MPYMTISIPGVYIYLPHIPSTYVIDIERTVLISS